MKDNLKLINDCEIEIGEYLKKVDDVVFSISKKVLEAFLRLDFFPVTVNDIRYSLEGIEAYTDRQSYIGNRYGRRKKGSKCHPQNHM